MVETYRRLSMKMKLDPDLALEAKALVVLAFRNGPIEDLHAGKPCAVCSGRPEVSHISDDEMKVVMKSAVDAMYRLLWQRDYDPVAYKRWRSDAATPFTGMILNSRNRGEGHARSDLLTRRDLCSRSLPPTCGSAQSC
jgi:hypothetical protein